MKRILFLLILLVCSPAFALDRITIQVTVTNIPSSGHTLTINSSTRTWTTSATPSTSQIGIGGSIGNSATNLFSAFAGNMPANMNLVQISNGIKLIGNAGVSMSGSMSNDWGVITVTTNTVQGAGGTPLIVPAEAELPIATRAQTWSRAVTALNTYSTNFLNLALLNSTGAVSNQVIKFNGIVWTIGDDDNSGGGGSGEVNTASNLGTGYGIWRLKSGVDLQFNSVTSTAPVTVSLSGSNLVWAFDGTQTFVASGATTLNASSLSSGTVPDARFPATLPAMSGANLTSLNGTQITSGTIPDARLSSAFVLTSMTFSVAGGPLTISGNGNFSANRTITYDGSLSYNASGATNLNATQLLSGTVPDARISSTFVQTGNAVFLAAITNVTGDSSLVATPSGRSVAFAWNNANGYVTASITNGYVTATVTNGLATIVYVNGATNGLVTATVTNGLASIAYVNAVTNGLASVAYVNAATSGLVTATVTNGLTPNTITLTASTGLTGGGNLTADRSFAIDGTVVTTNGGQNVSLGNLNVSGRYYQAPVQLLITAAGNVTNDWSLGNVFVVGPLTANITILAPLNPVNGQTARFHVLQATNGGTAYTVTYASGFRTTNSLAATFTTDSVSNMSYIGFAASITGNGVTNINEIAKRQGFSQF